MPYSSGGGSHGGGGGGSHSSGGGSAKLEVQTTYFKNSICYVRYRNNKPDYIYTNKEIPDKCVIWPGVVLYIIISILSAMMVLAGISLPNKIMNDYGEVEVCDNANLLSLEEKAELINVLEEFKEKSGIVPCVMTVNNEDWDFYKNLESYAYDLYINNFDDEYHWLIVYSEPIDVNPLFNDWYWEGMQGDNTGRILAQNKTERFNKKLQKNLLNEKISVGEAFISSFTHINEYILNFNVNTKYVLYGIAMIFMMNGFLYLMLKEKKQFKINKEKYKDYKKCTSQEQIQEAKCDYCGNIYILSKCTNCPHCNAPIKYYYET